MINLAVNPLMRGGLRLMAAAMLAGLLSACAQNDIPPADEPDPLESTNRAIHAFNKGLDRNLLKPTSEVYVAVIPSPARRGVSNAVNNLSQPLNVINHLLQGDIPDAGASFFRFGMNTVFGLGGVLDPANDAGLFDRPTDFGETMAVWGVARGPYVELPVFGPSTTRDSLGRVVDFIADPVPALLPDGSGPYLVAAEVADVLQLRQDLGRVIDMLYYESADSYSAARIAYLQNRRRVVNNGLAAEDLENPYDF